MTTTISRQKGRPRKLDINNGVKTARHMFWKSGYDGVTISLLCDKLNVPPTSIYSAYQNKANLFSLVIENYMEDVTEQIDKSADNADDLATFVRDLLENLVNLYSGGPDQAGCLLFNCVANPKEKDAELTIFSKNKALELEISNNVRKFTSSNIEEITNALVTMLKGLSSQLRDGKSVDDLIPTIEFFCVIFD